ncbi:hypothetical protein BKA57DRAFT_145870 [Linnemannia elongata]|nr:hypothetical protein BKA57DRAFT_145870 [Linnemannia elongata]
MGWLFFCRRSVPFLLFISLLALPQPLVPFIFLPLVCFLFLYRTIALFFFSFTSQSFDWPLAATCRQFSQCQVYPFQAPRKSETTSLLAFGPT